MALIDYHYTMGITVNGTPIPDPSEWDYEVGDLDTSGSRDATGYLHRERVAQKINYGFSWKGLEGSMLQAILSLVSSDKFTLSAPDPRTFTESHYTAEYYVGDRTGKAYYYWVGNDEIAVFDLKLKFIEY